MTEMNLGSYGDSLEQGASLAIKSNGGKLLVFQSGLLIPMLLKF